MKENKRAEFLDPDAIDEEARVTGKSFREIYRERFSILQGGKSHSTSKEEGDFARHSWQSLHEQCLADGYGVSSVDEVIDEVRARRGSLS